MRGGLRERWIELGTETLPLIRELAAQALIEEGFDVIESEHAEHALAVFSVRAPEVHGLFTDIHMPGSMNGIGLAHHVHTHWPWVALLVTSGDLIPLAKDLPDGSRFLAKPYQIDHVALHLRQMIGVA